MLLEFIPFEDPDEVLFSTYDVGHIPVPRKGERLFLQIEKNEPYGEYWVREVVWHIDASRDIAAQVIVSHKAEGDPE